MQLLILELRFAFLFFNSKDLSICHVNAIEMHSRTTVSMTECLRDGCARLSESRLKVRYMILRTIFRVTVRSLYYITNDACADSTCRVT